MDKDIEYSCDVMLFFEWADIREKYIRSGWNDMAQK